MEMFPGDPPQCLAECPTPSNKHDTCVREWNLSFRSLLGRTLLDHPAGNHSPPQPCCPHPYPFPVVFITIRPSLQLTHCSLLVPSTPMPWVGTSVYFVHCYILGGKTMLNIWCIREWGKGGWGEWEQRASRECQHTTGPQAPTCLGLSQQTLRPLVPGTWVHFPLPWANTPAAMPTIQATWRPPTWAGSITKNEKTNSPLGYKDVFLVSPAFRNTICSLQNIQWNK